MMHFKTNASFLNLAIRFLVMHFVSYNTNEIVFEVIWKSFWFINRWDTESILSKVAVSNKIYFLCKLWFWKGKSDVYLNFSQCHFLFHIQFSLKPEMHYARSVPLLYWYQIFFLFSRWKRDYVSTYSRYTQSIEFSSCVTTYAIGAYYNA